MSSKSLIEAAQMAVEALKTIRRHHYTFGEVGYDLDAQKCSEAVEALQHALKRVKHWEREMSEQSKKNLEFASQFIKEDK